MDNTWGKAYGQGFDDAIAYASLVCIEVSDDGAFCINKSASKSLSRDAFSVHTEVYEKESYASTVEVLGWDRYPHFRRRPPSAVEPLRIDTSTSMDEQLQIGARVRCERTHDLCFFVIWDVSVAS